MENSAGWSGQRNLHLGGLTLSRDYLVDGLDLAGVGAAASVSYEFKTRQTLAKYIALRKSLAPSL